MKKILWAVSCFIVILICFFVYSLISSVKKTPPSQQPLPTVVPTVDVSYGKKLIQTLRERPTPVAKSDITIREELISPLDGNTGTITETTSFRLRYLKSANQFEASILSTPIDKAKDDVIQYLKQQGMTEDGICKLPLIFFAGEEISEELRRTNMPFTPIPNFCL